MKSTPFTKLALGGALAFTLAPAMADQQPGINVTAGDYFDIHQPYIGVGYQMPVSQRWSLEPNMEYVFVNSGHMYTFNVDGHYLLNPSGRNPMHVGAGLGMIRHSALFGDTTDSALNLTWGVDFNGYTGPLTPFINTKAVFSNNSDFAVSFGVRFGAPGTHMSQSATARNSSNANSASKIGS